MNTSPPHPTTVRPFEAWWLHPLPWILSSVLLFGLMRLDNAFVYDDVTVILQGEAIHNPSNIPGFFTHRAMWVSPHGGSLPVLTSQGVDTYRPLPLVTLAVDAMISGRDPWAYHLSNLGWHLLTLVMAYGLTRRLTQPWGGRWATAAVVLWFGIHPLLAEAHVWINGRSDVLAGALTLGAIWSLLCAGGATRWRRWALILISGGCALLACMSKEVAVVGLLLMPLWLRLDGHPDRAGLTPLWREARLLGPLLGVAFYFVCRSYALGGVRAGGASPELWLALARVPHLVLTGGGQALAPRLLSMRYLWEEYQEVPPEYLVASWLVALAALGLLWRQRHHQPRLGVGLLSFGLTLAPAALITLHQGWWGFNRYLYLPLALLLPGLAELLSQLRPLLLERLALKRALQVAGMVYLLLMAGMFWSIQSSYRTPLNFYRGIVDQAPESSHGYTGLGATLFREGHVSEAISALSEAHRRNPNSPRIRNNLIVAMLTAQQQDKALPLARSSYERWPDNPDFCNLLGLALQAEGMDAAVNQLLRCLEQHPEHATLEASLRSMASSEEGRAAIKRAQADDLPLPSP